MASSSLYCSSPMHSICCSKTMHATRTCINNPYFLPSSSFFFQERLQLRIAILIWNKYERKMSQVEQVNFWLPIMINALEVTMHSSAKTLEIYVNRRSWQSRTAADARQATATVGFDSTFDDNFCSRSHRYDKH